MTWRIEILNETVKAEIVAMLVDIRAKLSHILDMMSALGPQKMRMQGKDGIARAIYVLAHERRIVIVHAFMKKTQKTPHQALELAIQRAKELE